MSDIQSRATRALLDDLLEFGHLIARTPVFLRAGGGAVRVNDDLLELLARKRLIVRELRLRRARQRGPLSAPRPVSVSVANDAGPPVRVAPLGWPVSGAGWASPAQDRLNGPARAVRSPAHQRTVVAR